MKDETSRDANIMTADRKTSIFLRHVIMLRGVLVLLALAAAALADDAVVDLTTDSFDSILEVRCADRNALCCCFLASFFCFWFALFSFVNYLPYASVFWLIYYVIVLRMI